MIPLKILKACTTRWLTHGYTSVRVISRFKPLIAALDTIFMEKKDPVDQVNFGQSATFLGRNFNYTHDLGTSLEFKKIGSG